MKRIVKLSNWSFDKMSLGYASFDGMNCKWINMVQRVNIVKEVAGEMD